VGAAPQDAFERWAALQAWSNDETNRQDEATDLAFWERVAADYDPGALAVRVPAILERVGALVPPGSSILEVGAGTGAFTIPLAAQARLVTALDYSPAMLAVLRAKLARDPMLSNVRTVLARWEDAEVESHDVVFVANALYRAADLKVALSKLVRTARSRGIVVWSVGRDPRRPTSGYRPGPDYIHLVDGLFALDVFANVQIVERVAIVWWDAP
jgi:2-polyprenyl-3-methyl-5-hydroxy-6-metoxy-1,4-benzoquinol methylase